ncbi:MAG TPA: TonB-dependent receptor [Candidatus Methanoperedens sp.]|nr:TonB-dependent receptor [Candidatus Methanoperedens sp.]
MHRSRLAAALALLLAGPALAQQPPASLTPLPVPEIVVSATRIESTLAASPDAVSVVTRAEIEALQARSVADVLETVPGVIVSRTGQFGGQTSAFLRGANSGHTLVLIDGVRANNAFNGRFDFADLPVDNIERIEVVRGPQSTRFGSDALGGVINIVTKKGAAASAAAALLELGSNAGARTRASLAVGAGPVGLSLEAGAFDTDNERANAAYHGAGGSFGANWRPNGRFDLALTGSHRESRAGSPNDRFTNDPNDRTRTAVSLATLAAHAVPVPWWDARLSLSAGRERVRFDGPAPNPPFFLGGLKTDTVSDSARADLQNVLTLGPGHRLFLGLSHDRAPTEYTSTSSFGAVALDRTVKSGAASAQYDWSPAKSFTGSLGGRVDDFSSFGTHATWRAGARWTAAGSGTILRANAGTGFKAPTVADLYYPGFSNPDLEPEESLGWDVGVEQPLLGGRLQVGAAWFRNDFDNLIAYSTTSFRPENIADARTAGLEAFVQWLPAAGLSVSCSYTWLPTAEDRGSGARLLRRAEHSGAIAAHHRFPRWVQLDTALRFSGESNDKNFTSLPAQDVRNGGFLKWDVGVTVTPRSWLSLAARVENLLDDSCAEAYGFPALGRVFWGGATVRF